MCCSVRMAEGEGSGRDSEPAQPRRLLGRETGGLETFPIGPMPRPQRRFALCAT
jgi:hypothetical protein